MRQAMEQPREDPQAQAAFVVARVPVYVRHAGALQRIVLARTNPHPSVLPIDDAALAALAAAASPSVASERT
jgi:hypothetical protein